MKFKLFSLFAGAALLVSIAGCGNNNTATNNGQCPAGQFPTQHGCLAQGSCPAGQAQYQNSCVQTSYNQQGTQCPAGQVYTQQYSCQPVAPANYCPQNGQQYAWVNNQCVQAAVNNGQQYGQQYGQQCPANQVHTTQYGCQALAPANYCPQNGQQYAWVNNQCVPATTTQYNQYGQYGQQYGNQCGAGAVYTQYGCLPQQGCQPNSGFMNGQCYPAYQNYNNYGGGTWGGSWGGGVYIGVGTTGGACPYGTWYYNGMCVR